MLKNINPITTNAWHKLSDHFQEMKKVHMRALFSQDPNRFNRFHIKFGDFLFDYSKNIITEETMELLYQLAEECKINDAIKRIFSGDKINVTENRAVLHSALRCKKEEIFVDGVNVIPKIKNVQKKIKDF